MPSPPCALIVFGLDTRFPTIVAIAESTIDAISSHQWTVLARDTEILPSIPACKPSYTRGDSYPR